MESLGLNSVSKFNFQDGRHLKQTRLENGECPECGAILDHTEGCQLCRCCGWSGCES